MIEFFQHLFSTDFMAHGYCLRLPEVIWLHQISDAIIGFSYLLIPLVLVRIVRSRPDLVIFPWMYWLFGVFILSCGATHIMSIYTLWHPVYRLDGVVKAITAASSFPTALLLMRLAPKIMTLPSPDSLRTKNRQLASEIRERKRAEQAVRTLNEDLEGRVLDRTAELEKVNIDLRRALNDMEQFAWSATHDLREPVRNIALLSEFLKERHSGGLTPQGQGFLDVINGSANRMDRMLSDLTLYSKLSTEEKTPAHECDTAAVTDAVLTDLSEMIRTAGATVERKPLLIAPIAAEHFGRVIQNLVSNSIKYRQVDTKPVIVIDGEAHGDHFKFWVKDNGIGIAKQYQESVFELFIRLHSREKVEGNGIGLPICRRIVEHYGGKIWIESQPEQGTTVYFTVPR